MTMQREWTEKNTFGGSGKVNTCRATLQSNALWAQLQQARKEVRSDTDRALQTFIDCLQAAGVSMIKKIKTGVSERAAKWFDKECFDCRRLTRW